MVDKVGPTVILVVEDEPFIRMGAVDFLTGEGRVILEAGCVEEALAILDSDGPINLLFTDINMPGELDGIDLARIACSRQPSLKLIVTSGAKAFEDSELPDHGIFLSKPYSSYSLIQLVQTQLEAFH